MATVSERPNAALEILIDGTRGLQDDALGVVAEAAEAAVECDQVRSGIWDLSQARRFLAADALKAWLETAIEVWFEERHEGFEDCKFLVMTLSQWAFESIDWNDLALHYLGKLDEGVADE